MSVRAVATEAYRAALPVVLVSAVGGLFAGWVLGGMRAELTAVPGLLALVPALLATRGNVYGSLGARLGSALHQGLIEPTVSLGDNRLRAAVGAAVADGLLVSATAALGAVVLLAAIGRPVAGPATLVAVAVLSAALSGVALTVAVVGVVFAGYRRGLDPDTLAGPVVTTTGDVVGLATVAAAARVVLWAGGG